MLSPYYYYFHCFKADSKIDLLSLLFCRNYKKNFYKFFLSPNEDQEDHSLLDSSVEAERIMYLKFGWMLFLALRMHAPGQFVDLMTCANGLIAIFVSIPRNPL